MRLIIILVACLLLCISCKNQPKTIILSDYNTVWLNAPIIPEYIAVLKEEILHKELQNPPGTPLYVVLYSPGGSVYAGAELIQLLQTVSVGRPVISISQIAYSMAFIISQYTDKRYIVPNGEMMAHSARIYGLDGTYPGTLQSRLSRVTDYINNLLRPIARRIQMPFNDFLFKLESEWWINAPDAMTYHLADEIVYIMCDESLRGTISKSFQLDADVSIVITSAKCPILIESVNISVVNNNLNQLKE